MIFSILGQSEPGFIRAMRQEHIPACRQLHAGAFARGWTDAEFEQLLQDRTVLAHVLTDGTGQRLQGFAVSRHVLDEAELLTIVLDPALRGQGRGRQLLETHFAALRAAGVRTIFLEVAEDNKAARALYSRFGFAEVGKRAGYYPAGGGLRATALVLRRNQ